MKNKMSKAQQLAASRHARHKKWMDDAERSLASYVLSPENGNPNIQQRGLGRGLHKWASKVLSKSNEKENRS